MKEKTISFKKVVGLLAVVFTLTMMMGMTTFAAKLDFVPAENGAYQVTNTKMGKMATYDCKFTIPYSGAVTFGGSLVPAVGVVQEMPFQILDSKKNPLTTATYKVYANPTTGQMKKMTVALKAGTYYVRIKTDKAFACVYGYEKLIEKSGSSKSTAVKLRAGRGKIGLLQLGEDGRKVDWYKIVLKRPKRLKIQITPAAANGYMMFELLKDGTKIVNNKFKVKGTPKAWTSYSQVPKGTYYVKVYRRKFAKKTTGAYQLMYQIS